MGDEQLVAFYERFGFVPIVDAPGMMCRPAEHRDQWKFSHASPVLKFHPRLD